MAALALFLAGCRKSPVPPAPEPDPFEEPETPPEPPYNVLQSNFSTTRDGLRIGGFLFTPEGVKGRKPAVIFCHGLDGSWKDTEPYARAATTAGYVSCCFDFCGGPQGPSISEGDRSDNSVLTEVQDLKAVYQAVSAREDVDPGKVFLMGGSQGGLVAALYAAENPSVVAAMGLMFPAFNLPDLVRFYIAVYYEGDLDKVPESITYSGHTFGRKYAVDVYDMHPSDLIGAYEGPVLILHGDNDQLVPLSSSQSALQIYKDATLFILEGEGHGFSAAGTEKAIGYLLDFLAS